jgi:hypothetical protein
MTELTDQQKQTLAQWVAAGDSLADIQRKLKAECGLSLTYMDVRFLVLEAGLAVQDRAEPPAAALDAAAAEPAPDAAAPDAGGAAGPSGAVRVDVDRVTKPGTVVSGAVTFSDGVRASWSLDQLGRLAILADQPGYRPSAEDVSAFQQELQSALARQGY